MLVSLIHAGCWLISQIIYLQTNVLGSTKIYSSSILRTQIINIAKLFIYRQKFKEYKDLYLQYLKNPNNERVKSQYQQLEYDMDVHNIMTAREDAKVEVIH